MEQDDQVEADPAAGDALSILRMRMKAHRERIQQGVGMSPSPTLEEDNEQEDDEEEEEDDSSSSSFEPSLSGSGAEGDNVSEVVVPTVSLELASENESPEDLSGYDADSLRRNLELAISTIRDLQKRLIACNRSIETLTFERNQLRREARRSRRGYERARSALFDWRKGHDNEKDLAIANEKLEAQRRVEEARTLLKRETEVSEATNAELSAAASRARQAESVALQKCVDLERELATTTTLLKESEKSTAMRLCAAERELGAALADSADARDAADASAAASLATAQSQRRLLRMLEDAKSTIAEREREARNLEKLVEESSRNETDARRLVETERKAWKDAAKATESAIKRERSRVALAERREREAVAKLEQLDESRNASRRAHLGARRALEKTRTMAETDVARAVDARRAAIDKIALLREKLDVSEKCRSAAANQLKCLRQQTKADRAEIAALKTKLEASEEKRGRYKQFLKTQMGCGGAVIMLKDSLVGDQNAPPPAVKRRHETEEPRSLLLDGIAEAAVARIRSKQPPSVPTRQQRLTS